MTHLKIKLKFKKNVESQMKNIERLIHMFNFQKTFNSYAYFNMETWRLPVRM